MGLDAAVYRNVNALKAHYGAVAFDVEQETGEAMPRPGYQLRVPRATLVAIERRLGNLDGIGKLRATLSALLDAGQSILLRKVLYNGSHGGDVIKSADFEQITHEIAIVRHGISDPSAVKFVNQMEELVNVARSENNPIVFI